MSLRTKTSLGLALERLDVSAAPKNALEWIADSTGDCEDGGSDPLRCDETFSGLDNPVRLQNNLDATILFIAERLVHFRSFTQTYAMSNHEGGIDSAF